MIKVVGNIVIPFETEVEQITDGIRLRVSDIPRRDRSEATVELMNMEEVRHAKD